MTDPWVTYRKSQADRWRAERDAAARDRDEARRLAVELADRVFRQSELLSRRAERRPVSLSESCENNYPEG